MRTASAADPTIPIRYLGTVVQPSLSLVGAILGYYGTDAEADETMLSGMLADCVPPPNRMPALRGIAAVKAARVILPGWILADERVLSAHQCMTDIMGRVEASEHGVLCSQAELARFEGRSEHTAGLTEILKGLGVLRSYVKVSERKWKVVLSDPERHQAFGKAVARPPRKPKSSKSKNT
jgi:hypothetical protein